MRQRSSGRPRTKTSFHDHDASFSAVMLGLVRVRQTTCSESCFHCGTHAHQPGQSLSSHNRGNICLRLSLSRRGGNSSSLVNYETCQLQIHRKEFSLTKIDTPFVVGGSLSCVKAANLQHCPSSARRESLRCIHCSSLSDTLSRHS